MHEFIDILQNDIFETFTNPKKRLFWGYLLTALLISFLWLCLVKQENIKNTALIIFSKKIWLSGSSRIDLKCFFVNKILLNLFKPYFVTQIVVATALFELLHMQSLFKLGMYNDVPFWVATTLFTITFFLIDDWSRFFVHSALHKIPFLWEFHKFHHSAQTLTPLTVTRTHPIEGMIFMLRSAATQGVTIAIFVFLFGQQITLITVLGVNVSVIFFHGLGSNLRHSHIAIRYPVFIEKYLMSPAQHQLHHSIKQEHFDKNFGVALSIWDRLNGSFMHSKIDQFEFGIGSETSEYTKSLANMYLSPFKYILEKIVSYFQLKRKKMIGSRVFNKKPIHHDGEQNA
jgi:sterol desaturase/sphingolipid hydroxylase (fatty acid hydroxylase superfamily)